LTIYRSNKAKRTAFAESSARYVAAPARRGPKQGRSIFKVADQLRTFDEEITTADAKRHFAALLARVTKDHRRVVLTQKGEPVACLVPMIDIDFIEELEDVMDAKAVDDAKKEWAKGGFKTITIEELARKYGITLDH